MKNWRNLRHYKPFSQYQCLFVISEAAVKCQKYHFEDLRTFTEKSRSDRCRQPSFGGWQGIVLRQGDIKKYLVQYKKDCNWNRHYIIIFHEILRENWSFLLGSLLWNFWEISEDRKISGHHLSPQRHCSILRKIHKSWRPH